MILFPFPFFVYLVAFAQTDFVFLTGVKQNYFTLRSAVSLNSIQKVDSLAQVEGPARRFAQFYSLTMAQVNQQVKGYDSISQDFIQRFELHFADYFLDDYYNEQKGMLASNSDWRTFYAHPNVTQWQSILFGVNVHVNIDISKTIIHHFSSEEIKAHKKQLLAVQLSVAKVYDSFFEIATRDNKYLKFINSFTHGFAKFAGKRWLYKWRKRNVRLGILYYDDPAKYQRLLARVKRKKQKTDQLILKQHGLLL